MPVHRRRSQGKADGSDSRRGGRRRHGRDPARQAGWRNRALDRLHRREARTSKDFGLGHGINYASENFVERTRELTDGRGADVILDSIGGQNLVDSIGALAYRGTLVSVGLAGRAGSAVEARALWEKNNSLRGVFLSGALLNEYPRVHRWSAS